MPTMRTIPLYANATKNLDQTRIEVTVELEGKSWESIALQQYDKNGNSIRYLSLKRDDSNDFMTFTKAIYACFIELDILIQAGQDTPRSALVALTRYTVAYSALAILLEAQSYEQEKRKAYEILTDETQVSQVIGFAETYVQRFMEKCDEKAVH